MATVKRQLILDAIKENVLTIRAGVPVGGVINDTYSNTVGLVTYGYLDVTQFADAEFPVVLINGNLSSSFSPNGDGYTSSATWPIAFEIYVKDDQQPSTRDSAILEKIESMFRDLDMALHRNPQISPTADAGIVLRSFDPAPMADPTFGAAVAIYDVIYVHESF